ncbi:efflux RND transporter periplasmic adaptor subunit (plasmid) [Falsihalocynthiibacter sp. SS001]|uniref:efflux RND transporter periplasmic adaptor subunit n=1 Tax=Falsihalocynthiibacter sp. SS001 TaxID=3349698 RepID=UPI0036D34955
MTETNNNERQTLKFENDRGSTRSRWVAGIIAVAIVGWMGSGIILPSENPEASEPASVTVKPVTVAVIPSVAESIEQYFVAEGQALPDRDTVVRAETSGQIEEILVDKGAQLESGQVIAKFDIAARGSDLDRAQEELTRAQREFDNASALVDRGVATVDRLSVARATLASAQANLKSATEAIKNTEIRAPFAGRLETLDIDTGEFIALGTSIGRLVDNAPLTIKIQVPQQSLHQIRVGQSADVEFITGDVGTGEVEFVGSSADVDTRTFLAEIGVPNADGAIPAGISAQLRIPTGETTAHFVSPAILSLDTNGVLGVKTVVDGNKVSFHKVEIVRAQTDGVWVSGLPEEVQIISVGQGFVNEGETVNPVPEDQLGLGPETATADTQETDLANADTEIAQDATSTQESIE